MTAGASPPEDATRKVAHDLNNELVVIAASAELAAANVEPGTDLRSHLDRIRTAARATSELVRELQRDPPRAKQDPTPPTSASAVRAQSAGKVLVVDDSETMRQLIAYALEPSGFDVSVTADAEDALRRIGGGERPDLLLADVRMPAMSGPELAARARRIRPRLAIVFVTGDADEVIEFDGGAAPALRKPFVASELVEAVRTALADEPPPD